MKNFKHKLVISLIFIGLLVSNFHSFSPVSSDQSEESNMGVNEFSDIKAASINNYTLEWNQTLGGELTDQGNGIVADDDGNVYITGYIGTDTEMLNIYLAKLDKEGEIVWEKSIDMSGYDDKANDICLDGDNNIYLTGYTKTVTDTDAVIMKYDSNGEQLWIVTLDVDSNSELDEGHSIDLDSSNHVYICGKYDAGSSQINSFFAEFDENGGFICEDKFDFGSGLADNAFAIQVDDDKSIYIAGYLYDPDYFDIYIRKYSSSRSEVFAYDWDSSGVDDYIEDMVIDDDGNLYVAGYFDVPFTMQFLSKHNTIDGVRDWMITWGGDNTGLTKGLDLDVDGNVYTIGYTYSGGVEHSDVLLKKFNPDGVVLWSYTWGGPQYDYGYAVGVGSKGDIYITGRSNSFSSNHNIFVLKLAIEDLSLSDLFNSPTGLISMGVVLAVGLLLGLLLPKVFGKSKKNKKK